MIVGVPPPPGAGPGVALAAVATEDTVAELEVFDGGADGANDASGLVAGDMGEGERGFVGRIHFADEAPTFGAVADRGVLDLDKDVGGGHGGQVSLAERDAMRLRENNDVGF